MNLCCQNLLIEIADLYGTTPDEIIRQLQRPKCCFIYKKSTIKYKAGQKCSQPVVADDFVFCANHHKQASSDGGVYIMGTIQNGKILPGPGTATLHYDPKIGKLEINKSGGTSVVTLIAGDMNKFNKIYAPQYEPMLTQ